MRRFDAALRKTLSVSKSDLQEMLEKEKSTKKDKLKLGRRRVV
jgi:hypothetical protein